MERSVHRIPHIDGTYRQSEFLRWARTLAYVLMGFAGVLLVVSPAVPLVYGGLGLVMAWFLVIGGVLSAIGSGTGRWFGEFTGLPLLGPAFGTFGFLVWDQSVTMAPFLAAANLSLLLAIGVVMAARWRVVYAIYRLAAHLGKDTHDE